MNSEKVREIKECLEVLNEYGETYITKDKTQRKFVKYADILTLINELESVNKWLVGKVKEKVNEMTTYTVNNQKLKNRIADLEKEKTCVWEEWTDGDHSIWCCSNCKEDFCFIEGDVYENNYGYCPHCGAKITALKEMQEDNDIDETLKEFINKGVKI